MNVSILFIYLVAIIIIVLLVYLASKPSQKIQIYNELPPPARFQTHWWGFGWRPWWRRYGGVPGLQEPTIPKPPKPIILQK
jgi:hypothetical protein